jgi:hypothetical protein
MFVHQKLAWPKYIMSKLCTNWGASVLCHFHAQLDPTPQVPTQPRMLCHWMHCPSWTDHVPYFYLNTQKDADHPHHHSSQPIHHYFRVLLCTQLVPNKFDPQSYVAFVTVCSFLQTQWPSVLVQSVTREIRHAMKSFWRWTPVVV